LSSHYSTWSDAYPSVRGRRENEILRFNNIEAGDRILVPYNSSVALATAGEEHRYVPDTGIDFSNQIAVTYERDVEGELLTVARSDLTGALQSRLRVPGSTVTDLSEFANEIEPLFDRTEQFTWKKHHRKREERRREKFRDALLTRLQKRKGHLAAGGEGLEELIAELLRLDDFDEVNRLAKTAFEGEGDADIEATRADRFGEREILIQVKHHQKESGSHGVRQLQAIRQNESETWGEHELVLVTTGRVPKEVRDEAEQTRIVVLDEMDFIDWLLDHVDRLSAETRRSLGLSEVPSFID
jgi:restriction system protein